MHGKPNGQKSRRWQYGDETKQSGDVEEHAFSSPNLIFPIFGLKITVTTGETSNRCDDARDSHNTPARYKPNHTQPIQPICFEEDAEANDRTKG